MILARTLKGKGISFIEGKDGWHGKAFKKGEEAGQGARGARVAVRAGRATPCDLAAADPEAAPRRARQPAIAEADVPPPAYKLGDSVATREAYGTALAKLGAADARIVALDADVKNSTFSDKFEKTHPDRFYQNFIAEQVMIGSAMGLAARGAIPFPSTFACVPHARVRLHPDGARSATSNVKMAGSHAGVSIGEDGPSQMALEDLAMMRAQPNMHGPVSVRRGEHRAAGRADGLPSRPGLHAHQPRRRRRSSTVPTRRSRSAG